MKAVIIILSLALSPVLMHAQSASLEKLFDKYNGKEGYSIVTINQSMFDLFKSVSDNKSDEDFKSIAAKLKGIKILTCESKECDDLYKEAAKFLTTPDYEELMNVNDGGETVKFYMKKNGNKIVELVMASSSKKETCIMLLQGEIDLKEISKLSKSMNISGMDKLEDISKTKSAKSK